MVRGKQQAWCVDWPQNPLDIRPIQQTLKESYWQFGARYHNISSESVKSMPRWMILADAYNVSFCIQNMANDDLWLNILYTFTQCAVHNQKCMGSWALKQTVFIWCVTIIMTLNHFGRVKQSTQYVLLWLSIWRLRNNAETHVNKSNATEPQWLVSRYLHYLFEIDFT